MSSLITQNIFIIKKKPTTIIIFLNKQSDCQASAQVDYLLEVLDRCLLSVSPSSAEFVAYYRSELCLWMCKRSELVLGYLLGKLGVAFCKCVNLLVNLTEFVCGDKSLRKAHGKRVVDKWGIELLIGFLFGREMSLWSVLLKVCENQEANKNLFQNSKSYRLKVHILIILKKILNRPWAEK